MNTQIYTLLSIYAELYLIVYSLNKAFNALNWNPFCTTRTKLREKIPGLLGLGALVIQHLPFPGHKAFLSISSHNREKKPRKESH